MDDTPETPDGFETDEAAITAELVSRRIEFQAVLGDKAQLVEHFGKRWILAGGCVLIAGAVTTGTGAVIDEIDHAEIWLLLASVFFVGLISIITAFTGGRMRTVLLLAVPCIVTLLVAGIISYLGFRYWRNPPWYEVMLTVVLTALGFGLLLYPLTILIGLSPVASSIARLYFPTSRIAATWGFICGIFWILLLILVAYGYYVIIKWQYQWSRNYGHSTELGYIFFLILAALPGLASGILPMFNSRTLKLLAIKWNAGLVIVLAMICAGLHVLIGTIAVIEGADGRFGRYDWGQFLGGTGFIIMGVGLLIIFAIASSGLIMHIAHRHWKRKVNQEIQRINIELST